MSMALIVREVLGVFRVSLDEDVRRVKITLKENEVVAALFDNSKCVETFFFEKTHDKNMKIKRDDNISLSQNLQNSSKCQKVFETSDKYHSEH